ncbi:hypothetical protein GCM10009092_14670 [Bowmanella denitrificans]|uniref:Uncharacterized protein n=1 Tax=Bowmanella denitrificans TaxID=366582 RepID=A0ABN0WZL7_9ALTE
MREKMLHQPGFQWFTGQQYMTERGIDRLRIGVIQQDGKQGWHIMMHRHPALRQPVIGALWIQSNTGIRRDTQCCTIEKRQQYVPEEGIKGLWCQQTHFVLRLNLQIVAFPIDKGT